MIDLTEYMRVNIKILLRQVMHASLRDPRELFFLLRCGIASRRAYRAREKFEKQGKHIPPFLIASITQDCNLHCKGCYAMENKPCHSGSKQMTSERWREVFAEAGNIGVTFILLAGGEPMMRMDVLKKAAETHNILFPVFTNGTLMDENAIELFRKNRHLVPVLSLEGDEKRTDERRGVGTFAALTAVMD
ncbi:MAG: radical SAM protein [Eubacteriales bacterium]